MTAAILGLLFQLQVASAHAGMIDLGGPWRFHPGDSLSWASPEFNDTRWDTLQVPGAWHTAGPGVYRGYGWYRLHLDVRGPVDRPLGLWLRSVATAFEVYIDGERLGAVGEFPPDYHARTVVPLVVAFPPAATTPGQHLIAVRVYSGERVGGITGEIFFGPLQQIEHEVSLPNLYLIAAAVLLVGIGGMQLFFWLRRPHAREHLAIFGVCASLALFFVWWMPAVRVALSPYVFWFRLYLASAAFSAAAYAYAFHRIFDLDRRDRIVIALALTFLVMVPAFLMAPSWDALTQLATYVFNPILLVGALITLVLAFWQFRLGAHHARLLLWGTLLLTVTLFHDVLEGWGLIAVRPTFPWLTLVGSVGFVASLALTTAEKFLASEEAALYDRLTGLYRREVVVDALAREIRRASRVRQPLAVIMLDVDRFKQINDTLGHQAGDKVLAELGRRMLDAGRAVDWLGRYGGEEFIAILAASDREGAKLAAERLRSAVSALPIATGRTARTVTLSAGVAAYEGGDEWPTVEQLIGAADAALYRAKDAGRNRVEA
ncbi:MAG TPA: diguanylate cyclase [Gemmatimonadales bacterium]|jgi:diguanylate cyclase (GGDEF)-like protein